MANLSLVFLSEQLLIAREWYSIVRTLAINKSNTTDAFKPEMSGEIKTNEFYLRDGFTKMNS